jgi:hypothetical protein
LQLIFNSLVQPYFNYFCTVWDNCNKTLAEKLQKLQNRAARVLTFCSCDTNADVLIEKLAWKNYHPSASSNIEADRSGFLRWQCMAVQGRRII